jgi:hypothetical protein
MTSSGRAARPISVTSAATHQQVWWCRRGLEARQPGVGGPPSRGGYMLGLNTFSIAARCARTGMAGVAVSTAAPAVGAVCPFVKAGAGAIIEPVFGQPLSRHRRDPAARGGQERQGNAGRAGRERPRGATCASSGSWTGTARARLGAARSARPGWATSSGRTTARDWSEDA